MRNLTCDEEIYQNGVCIGIIGNGDAEIIELIVKKIAEKSGQKVAWYYFGGRSVVKTTGDVEKVREQFKRYKLKYLDM